MSNSNRSEAPAPEGQAESFEEILGELQGLVDRLEKGDLSLGDSLEAFERGVALSRRGQAILDAAEKRVELLLDDGSTGPLDPPPADSSTEA